jgi:hypothetical protein
MLAPCSAPSRLNERRYAPALTAPARVAGDDGQAGMKERLPARTKELDDEALTTEEPRPGLREETERWRSVFPARANTGDPNGPTRGRSANQIARALISMMARSNQLQSEAGYIDARPLSQIDDPSCDARPDHTYGSKVRVPGTVKCVHTTPKSCHYCCGVTIYDGVDAPPDGIDVPKWRC